MNDGPDCLDAQLCRGDFYEMLEDAIRQCGGNPGILYGGPDILGHKENPLTDWPLHEVVKLLAQNGIRMVYVPEKHIDRIMEAKR